MRIGYGEDIHATAPGNKIKWGGIEIPAPFCLKGVSDADVLLHALTDALLGAIAAGDIGQYFPPQDPQNQNRDSREFLLFAYEKVRASGFVLANADLTLLCEQPKLAPYRDKIRNNIAAMLQVEVSQINLKATTTEKLGFLGRQEGIAAKAIVLLQGVQSRL